MSEEDIKMLLDYVEYRTEELGEEETQRIKNLAKENAKLVISEMKKAIEKYGSGSEYGEDPVFFVSFFEAFFSEISQMFPDKEDAFMNFAHEVIIKEEEE